MNLQQTKVWQNTKGLIHGSDKPLFFLKDYSLYSLGSSWREKQALGKISFWKKIQDPSATVEQMLTSDGESQEAL